MQGLPELTGSERQVLWAASIRRETLQQIAAVRARIPTPQGLELWDAQASELVQEAAAAWWIDHRDGRAYSAFQERCRQAVREYFAQNAAP